MYRPPVFPMHSVSSLKLKGRSTIGYPEQPDPDEEERRAPRPKTMPNIIGFDGFGMSPVKYSSKANGYFPPRKPKSSKGTPRNRPATRYETNADIDLSVEANSGVTSPRPFTGLSTATSDTYKSRCGFRPGKSRETPRATNALPPRYKTDASAFIPERPTFQGQRHNDNTMRSGDLSSLAKPRSIEAGRCSPWVYRYKVKRSMNSLSQIMASSPNVHSTPSLAMER